AFGGRMHESEIQFIEDVFELQHGLDKMLNLNFFK
ncbi:MAG: hypothetical protein ACJAU9_000930, partial [Lentimonas sp.]